MKVTCFATLAAALAIPLTSSAAVLFSEDFNVNATANWTVNNQSGAAVNEANIFYDYSAIGVPAAPNGTGTTGLKMTANNGVAPNQLFSGISVSPTGQSFSGNYKVEFDLWQNYVGPLGPGGNGTTQLSNFGIGTSGTVVVSPSAVTNESVMFGATLDGGSGVDYRVYSSAATTGYVNGASVFAAPYSSPSGTPDNRNELHPYYTSNFPAGSTAPAAQLALFPSQTGATEAGEISFKWRRVAIEVEDSIATWTVDNVLMATVDLSTVTLGGGNIFFGHSDTNTNASTAANRALLNVTLIDNVVVSQVIPEPATMALVALGCGLAAAARRRV